MVKLYDIGYGAQQEQIEDSLKKTMENIVMKHPEANKSIRFRNIRFERKKNVDDPTQFKDAVLTKRSVLARMFGDVVEVNNDTGQETVKATGVKLGSIPQLIESRGTFLVNGNEYNLVNQLRKNSAPYVTKSQDGSEVYADFNLAKGRNFSITLNQRDSLFYIEIGSSMILLKALLMILEVNPEDFKGVVGEKLFQVNWADIPDSKLELNYRKLYSKVYEYKKTNVKDMRIDTVISELKKYYAATKVDPETTEYLYNSRNERVTAELVLATLRKYMEVYNDESPAHNQDDLYYQKLYTPNLLFKDRVEKLRPEIEKKVHFKVKADDYEGAFKDAFTKPMVSLVNTSNLSRLDPQYNPLGILSVANTITPLGMGGINDITAVRRGTRGVHTSSMGIIDPIESPQGQKIGVTLKATNNFKVDEDGKMYIRLMDRDGNVDYRYLSEMYNKKVALPDVRPEATGKVDVIYQGKISSMDASEIEYYFPEGPENTIGDIDWLIPMANAVQGNRNFMSSRFMTQALPLQFREKANVISVLADGTNAYKKVRSNMEKLLPLTSPVDGKIKSIKDNQITITGDDGSEHVVAFSKHLPLATNTGVHQRPVVRPGYKVKKGEPILKDYYTSDDELAFGVNLKTAFMPYRGMNTEDAVVISESAAEKLTSVHYYKYDVKLGEDVIVNKKSFTNQFSRKYTPEQLDKLGEDGVVLQGSKVHYGDPLIAVIKKITPDDRLAVFGKISKNIVINLSDESVLYNHHVEGEVIEIIKKQNIVTVTVKTFERATIGDKISGRYGNKSVISTIIADDKMPQDENKEPVDVLFASSVVSSRMNPAQIYEQALNKIVTKTGRDRYEMPILRNPDDKPLDVFVNEELKKYNIKDKEYMYDPITGKTTDKPVSVGNMYTMKLLKGDKDLSARGVGPNYTSNWVPAKGGNEGAKSIGFAEFYAMVSHNARNILTEQGTVKGQYNPTFWKNFELGLSTPLDKNSFAFDRFKANMTTAGGHIVQTSKGHEIVPLTDKITNSLAQHREIKTPELLRAKNLEPIKEGLYDLKNTGGVDGKLWAKINLNDGILSPLVKDYVKLLFGFNTEQLKTWEASHDTEEMKRILGSYDVDKKLQELDVKSKQRSGLNNNEVKLYRFLSNIKRKGLNLSDLVLTSIPVPPPVYRPLVKLQDGNIQLADLNHFYKDVMLANEAVNDVSDVKDLKKDAKKELIASVDALVGRGEPTNIKLKNKGAKGILAAVGGVGTPKNGFIHSTMVKKTQDLSARARIIPDSKMDMDTIGIPENMAWKLYAPFVRKTFIQSGMTPLEAEAQIKDRSAKARVTMVNEMERRPVMYNRAPTLHRFGMLAAKPKLVTGNTIHVSLFAVDPLNADFDGDAIQIHVPVTNAAIREMEKLKLSQNIFNDNNIEDLVTSLTTEAVLGIYWQSSKHYDDFMKDMRRFMPEDIALPRDITKKKLNKILIEVAKKHPERVSEIFLKLKTMGEEYATLSGISVGVDDVAPAPIRKKKEQLLRRYRPKIEAETDKVQRAKIMEELQREMMDISEEHPGDLTILRLSGAKGKSNQLAGIFATPTIAYDPDDPINTADLTEGSFGEGMKYRDFWNQNMKARKDMVGTALNVSVPGEMSKLLVASLNKEVVTEEDCNTTNGVLIDSSSKDILGRVLQQNSGGLKRNTVITTANQFQLAPGKVLVRSPEKCEANRGVCQLCYGADSYGKLVDIGVNVGVRATHAISAPLAQMALDSKHGGRSITKDVGQGGLHELSRLFSSNPAKDGMAVIAKDDGVVDLIETTPAGLRKIHMDDGIIYHVDKDLKVLVKEGDEIDKGQQLSSGVIPFTEIANVKGINAGRQALSGELYRILDDNGKSLHKRLPELLGKAALNNIEVLTRFVDFIPGDVVPYNEFKRIARENSLQIPVADLEEGMIPAEEYGILSVGTPLSKKEVEEIKRTQSYVRVLPEDVKVRPVTKSLYTSGLVDDDWMNHLGARYIKRELVSATAEGKVTENDTLSPIPKWIQGRPFNISTARY